MALGEDCILQHKDDTMYSHNVFSSYTNIGMTFEVPTIDPPNDMWKTLKYTKVVLPKLELSEEHRLLDNQIITQKQRESLPSELSIHDIGNYTISSLLVGGIVVAIGVLQIRRYLATRKKSDIAKKQQALSTKPRKKAEDIELEEITTYAAIDRHSKNPK